MSQIERITLLIRAQIPFGRMHKAKRIRHNFRAKRPRFKLPPNQSITKGEVLWAYGYHERTLILNCTHIDDMPDIVIVRGSSKAFQ